MRNFVLATAAVAALAATPALAQTKETRVDRPVAKPVVVEKIVEKVVVREVPGPERVVYKTVAAAPRTRTSDAFTGWKAGAYVGAADVGDIEEVTYGVVGGYDAPIGDRVVVGLDVDFADFAEDHRRLGAGARLGYAVNESVLPFARVGYSETDLGKDALGFSGLEVGGGVELAVSQRWSITPEYRYTDFNGAGNGAHGVRVGVAFRF